MQCRIRLVYWVAKYRYEPNWGVRRHSHEFFQFFYAVDGSSLMSVADTGYPSEAGMLVLIKPNVDHEIYKIMDQGHMSVHDIKFNILEERMKGKVMELPFLYEYPDEITWKKIVEMRREWKSKSPTNRELCAVLVQEILFLLLRQSSASPSRPVQRRLEAENFSGITLRSSNT